MIFGGVAVLSSPKQEEHKPITPSFIDVLSVFRNTSRGSYFDPFIHKKCSIRSAHNQHIIIQAVM